MDCPVLPTIDTYKYLGVQLDLRNKPTHALHRLLKTATRNLSHLIKGTTLKIDYIRFKILPIILYTAMCSN